MEDTLRIRCVVGEALEPDAPGEVRELPRDCRAHAGEVHEVPGVRGEVDEGRQRPFSSAIVMR